MKINWWAITFLGTLLIGAVASWATKKADAFNTASELAFFIGIVWLFTHC